MNVLTRLWNTLQPAARGETRAGGGGSWQALSSLGPAGAAVSTTAAENLATVLRCTSAIASSISSLPAYVQRLVDGGREVDDQHPLARLIRRGPNAHLTWPGCMEFLVAQALLQGNGLAEIVTDQRGQLVELRPIPWGHCSVTQLPSGRLAYDVYDVTYIGGGAGRRRRLLEGEVVHLRDRTDDGLIGRSRLRRAAEVLGGALAIQNTTHTTFRRGLSAVGVVEAPEGLSLQATDELLTEWSLLYSGPANAGRPMILDKGMKFSKINITPEDAELLASRRFSVEEIARLFDVPPPIAGDLSHGSFANVEHLIRLFGSQTLAPWVVKIEAEFNRTILGEGRVLELDLSSFLRSDPQVRWGTHEIAVRNGILSPNEVREVEGWGPRAGGDEFARVGPAPAQEARQG